MLKNKCILTILFIWLGFLSQLVAVHQLRLPDSVTAPSSNVVAMTRDALNKETNGVKKYVLRIKESQGKQSANLQNPCDWQVGWGRIASLLPKLYTSGVKHTVRTMDGVKIDTIFHERPGAESIIFVAPGFANSASMYTPLLWIFQTSSIVFFDFRGHGSNLENSLVPRSYWEKKLKLPFGAIETTLGKREDLEVAAVVSYFKKLESVKKYKRFVGMGFCFGAAMIVKAQAKNPTLFTHLILDSLWPSYSKLVQKFLQDPELIFRPQKTTKSWVGKLFSYGCISGPFRRFLEKFVFQKSLKFKLNICKFLKQIKVPIFLIYGKNDTLIKPQDFELVWRSISHKNKMALINDYKHLLTFLKDKELYKVCSELFLNKVSLLN